jgi:hypothetical protein
MDALVTLASVALGQDFWRLARTPEKLGIAGLNIGQLLQYVQ